MAPHLPQPVGCCTLKGGTLGVLSGGMRFVVLSLLPVGHLIFRPEI